MILGHTRSGIGRGHLSSTTVSCAYGQAPCILVLVWDNHFPKGGPGCGRPIAPWSRKTVS